MAAGTRECLVLVVTAIFSVCLVAIKAGLAFAPPLRFAGLRTLIAGAGLLALRFGLRRPRLPARRVWRPLPVIALTATTAKYGALFLSPGRTGAGIASVLGNTKAPFAVVLAAGLLDERLTRGKLAALALGLIGLSLISSGALAGPDAYGFSGPVLALAASAGSAIGSVLVKRRGTQLDLLPIAAWSLLLGSLPLLTASALFEQGASVTWAAAFLGLLPLLAIAIIWNVIRDRSPVLAGPA